MRADTAQRDPERRDALLRALDRAARVAGNPARHEEIAAILARPDYLGKPAEVIARAMSGRLSIAAGRDTDRPRPDFLLFYRDAANYPWRSEEHTSELQSLMRISYAVFCLKKQNYTTKISITI